MSSFPEAHAKGYWTWAGFRRTNGDNSMFTDGTPSVSETFATSLNKMVEVRGWGGGSQSAPDLTNGENVLEMVKSERKTSSLKRPFQSDQQDYLPWGENQPRAWEDASCLRVGSDGRLYYYLCHIDIKFICKKGPQFMTVYFICHQIADVS